MTNAQLVALAKDQFKNYSTTTFSESLIRNWLDEGQIDIVRETGCVTTDYNFNVTDGTREYTLPADILKILHVKYYDGTDYSTLNGTTEDALEVSTDYPNESEASVATHYYIKQSATPTMGLYPTPSTDTGNAVRMHYVARPSDLTSAATAPNIPEPYQRLIALYAMWRCLQKDVKNETADRYRVEYERQIRQMKYDLRNWDNKQRPRMVPYSREHRARSVAHDN